MSHIRVWWQDDVIAWFDCNPPYLCMEDLLVYMTALGYAGLKEEDFDLSYMDGSSLQDVYLRRFENARV